MNDRLKSNSDQPLLDSVLADESWQALKVTLKNEALAVLAARKSRRRWIVKGTNIAAIAFGLAIVVWLWPARQRQVAVASAPSPSAAGAHAEFISEQEMLALFPPGSCVLAEVDGEKQLVFFDRQKAELGFDVMQRQRGL
jgi:hypothetical protein